MPERGESARRARTPGALGRCRSAGTWSVRPEVAAPTGDLWPGGADAEATLAPYVVQPGQSVTIPGTITPEGKAGTVASGTLYLVNAAEAAPMLGYASRYVIHGNRRLGYFPEPDAYGPAARGPSGPLWKRSTVWAAADRRPGKAAAAATSRAPPGPPPSRTRTRRRATRPRPGQPPLRYQADLGGRE